MGREPTEDEFSTAFNEYKMARAAEKARFSEHTYVLPLEQGTLSVVFAQLVGPAACAREVEVMFSDGNVDETLKITELSERKGGNELPPTSRQLFVKRSVTSIQGSIENNSASLADRLGRPDLILAVPLIALERSLDTNALSKIAPTETEKKFAEGISDPLDLLELNTLFAQAGASLSDRKLAHEIEQMFPDASLPNAETLHAFQLILRAMDLHI